MTTLYDLGIEIQNIRTILDNIEVKGQQNASLLVAASLKCTKLIEAINQVGKNMTEKAPESKEPEGDVNGE